MYGGISLVSRISGISRQTLRMALKNLITKKRPVLSKADVADRALDAKKCGSHILKYLMCLETRTAYVTHDITWYENHKAWPGLTCFGAVRRVCKVNAKVSDETRYYISSRKLSAEELLSYSRNEWGVESMHWLLDVIYNEDRTLLMEKDAQRTLNTLRKTALKLVRMYKTSLSPKSSLVGIMRNNLFNPQSILAFFKRLGSIKELCPN